MSNRQDDYNKLLATLRGLSIEDLLLLFIEAKTGSQADVDKLPDEIYTHLEAVGIILDNFIKTR